jgi:hypothetical protein
MPTMKRRSSKPVATVDALMRALDEPGSPLVTLPDGNFQFPDGQIVTREAMEKDLKEMLFNMHLNRAPR